MVWCCWFLLPQFPPLQTTNSGVHDHRSARPLVKPQASGGELLALVVEGVPPERLGKKKVPRLVAGNFTGRLFSVARKSVPVRISRSKDDLTCDPYPGGILSQAHMGVALKLQDLACPPQVLFVFLPSAWCHFGDSMLGATSPPCSLGPGVAAFFRVGPQGHP